MNHRIESMQQHSDDGMNCIEATVRESLDRVMNQSDIHSRSFTVPLECEERNERRRYMYHEHHASSSSSSTNDIDITTCTNTTKHRKEQSNSRNSINNSNHNKNRPGSNPQHSKYSFLSGIHPELDEALCEIHSPDSAMKSDPRRRSSSDKFSPGGKKLYSDTKLAKGNSRKYRMSQDSNMNRDDRSKENIMLRVSEGKDFHLSHSVMRPESYEKNHDIECTDSIIDSISSKPKEITCRNVLNDSIDSLPFSLDGMDRAKRRIKSQAEKIRDLEAKLEQASTSNTTNKMMAEAMSRKVMSPEERLEAHKARKRQENKYKEKSGKWDAPPPLNQESLTTKVKRKDNLVDRLVADPKHRKIHDQVNRRVTRSMKRMANAKFDEGGNLDEDSDICARRSSRESTHEYEAQRHNNEVRMPDNLMKRLNMNVKERRSIRENKNDLPENLKRTLRGHKMGKKAWRMSQEFQAQAAMECTSDEYETGSDDDGDSDDQIRCETCFSAMNCEEDVDNPGIYYCRKCWEEYENGSQDDLGHRPSLQAKASKKKYDEALWVVHDNPKLGEMLSWSGKKKMSCLIETKDPVESNCVRILRGMIEYCGAVLQSGLDNSPVFDTGRGDECIRVSSIEGFVVNHEKVETRLAKNKSVYEFKLDPNESIQLTGRDAQMRLNDFLANCVGAVDVILAPQCSPGSWYPQREATSNSRKIAPQFRSNGFGYIRLGDDMGNNGLAFLSSDCCQTFFSSETVDQGYINEDLLRTASSFVNKSKSKKAGRKHPNIRCTSTKKRDSTFKKKLQTRNTVVVDSDIDSDSDFGSLANSHHDGGSESTSDAASILKELQSLEVAKDVKWKEKADLLADLGKAIVKPKSRSVCSNALNYIQDIVSAKNVNINVLRSALLVVEKIGYAMGHELVYHIAWKTIFIEILKLLKNKQVGGGAKEILHKLHGRCFTLGNSMVAISHVLGMGKTSNQQNRMSAGKQTPTSRNNSAVQKANNVEVIEWLAITTENERNMDNVSPLLEESSLSKLATFFSSHDSHRDVKCRKNALDGLLHTVLYGIDRLGMEKSKAFNLCIEIKDSSPRSWSRLTKSVNLILKDRMRNHR